MAEPETVAGSDSSVPDVGISGVPEPVPKSVVPVPASGTTEPEDSKLDMLPTSDKGAGASLPESVNPDPSGTPNHEEDELVPTGGASCWTGTLAIVSTVLVSFVANLSSAKYAWRSTVVVRIGDPFDTPLSNSTSK